MVIVKQTISILDVFRTLKEYELLHYAMLLLLWQRIMGNAVLFNLRLIFFWLDQGQT